MKVQKISRQQHHSFISQLPSASFLQIPEWAGVKSDWSSESLGILDGDVLVGAALLLKRKLPVVGKSFGYIPEGPLLSHSSIDFHEVIKALEDFARKESIFLLRIGPTFPYKDWSN